LNLRLDLEPGADASAPADETSGEPSRAAAGEERESEPAVMSEARAAERE
jgi:hypothetical protein